MFFSHYSSQCRSWCHFFHIAPLTLFFSRYSFGVAPCIVLLMLPLFTLLFLMCFHSSCVVTPQVLMLFSRCHSSCVVAPFVPFLPCYSFHTAPPTLQLSCLSSCVTLPMLLLSHCNSLVLLFLSYSLCAISLELQRTMLFFLCCSFFPFIYSFRTFLKYLLS